jgi:hypothetical protein
LIFLSFPLIEIIFIYNMKQLDKEVVSHNFCLV